jgi:predicted nucleic acid-binding protein
MKFAGRGRMLIVDASCLFEVVSRSPRAEQVRERLDSDPDQAAPHVIDVEVLSIVRREHIRGQLDGTAAMLALEDLRVWRGIRFSHRPLLNRAWELRENVRAWDAFYVALAEALDGTLLTLDERLSRAPGLRCAIELMEG